MTKKEKNTKKAFRYILPMFAIGALLASATPTVSVAAEDVTQSLPVYEVSVGETNLLGDLKQQVIEDRAENDEKVNLDVIDIDKSTIDVDGLDTAKTGIQAVTIKVNLVSNVDDTADSVGYSFIEDAVINMVVDKAPTLVLKSDAVTVNNGDTFNPETYIAYINDDGSALPALHVESDVDMSTDGEYTVKFTAVDLQGNSTERELSVTVKTPQEVLDRIAAEEEAARLAEEEAARLAEEEAARLAEEEAQASAYADYTGTGGVSGDGNNPYGGGFSNCTSGAWLLVAERDGVYLPNFGNAYEWLYNAQAAGYSTGSTPAAGAVAVYANHVAFVSSVNADGTVNIEEGGYAGHYMARTVSATSEGSQYLQGYIYIN